MIGGRFCGDMQREEAKFSEGEKIFLCNNARGNVPAAVRVGDAKWCSVRLP